MTETIKELLKRTTLANIVAAVSIVGGLSYGMITKAAAIGRTLVMVAAGYLFASTALQRQATATRA